jgi:hypothetical protein
MVRGLRPYGSLLLAHGQLMAHGLIWFWCMAYGMCVCGLSFMVHFSIVHAHADAHAHALTPHGPWLMTLAFSPASPLSPPATFRLG